MLNQLKGTSGLVHYERTMIVGVEKQGDTLVGGYSHYFDHSFVLVLNMIANLLMQMNNVSASITVYSHPISVFDTVSINYM